MVMREVRDAIAHILDRTTLKDVVDRVEASKARSEDALMYYI
jgi:DNA-binding IscR family transcriptional regulator